MNDIFYEKTKHTNEKWLGDIPESWGAVRLKNIFSIKKNIAGEEGHTVLSVTQRGIRPKVMTDKGQFAQDYSKYQLVERGDFVMNHMDLLTGWVDISAYDGVTSPDYRVFVNSNPAKFESRYYRYILQLCYSARIFYGLGQGVAGFGRWRLPADMFLNFRLPVPSLKEQVKIADFLDDQVSQIDSIIEEAKSSIEEYKQWRTAILFEAITGSIMNDVAFKNTRISWIGDIPSTWRLASLKFLCDEIMDGTHFSPQVTDSGYPYLTASDIHGVGIDYSVTKRISEEDYRKLCAQGCDAFKDDILIVKDGATTGRVGLKIDDTPCVMLSSVARLKAKKGVLNRYLMYLLMSDVMQQQIKLAMAGSAMPRITLTKLSNFTGIICPSDDQKAIVDYLDGVIPQVDSMITEKESFMTDLESYKRSLIYETVTGKRKVV